jgi:hypothetical protein
MTPLERVTERVNRLGDPNDEDTPRPLLTLQEFFEGNEVVGSMLCNCTPTPTPREIRDLLARIAARPEVMDVRVQVTMFDDPEWPFSDTVWIFTTASAAEVSSWFPKAVRPDEIREGWDDTLTYEPYAVPKGARILRCWWD